MPNFSFQAFFDDCLGDLVRVIVSPRRQRHFVGLDTFLDQFEEHSTQKAWRVGVEVHDGRFELLLQSEELWGGGRGKLVRQIRGRLLENEG